MKNEDKMYIQTALLEKGNSYFTGFGVYLDSHKQFGELLDQLKRLSLNIKSDDGFIVDFCDKNDEILDTVLISHETHKKLTGEDYTSSKCISFLSELC